MKIGICDDQQVYRATLIDYCHRYFGGKNMEYEIAEYASGEELLLSEHGDMDILLLDIEMKEQSGIQVKNWLGEEMADIRLLFVSSHGEFMPEAFGRSVYGFLTKPVPYDDFQKKMDTMMADMVEQTRFIMVEGAAGEHRILLKDILYIKSNRKYCEIYQNGQEGYLFSNKSIHQWQEELEPYGFGRCHKSYLVNYFHVDKVDREVLLLNGEGIPVSRQLKNSIQEDYRKFLWMKGR